MSIYIFSRPVHSGKTTELLEWCNLQNNIYGVLMPDVNGNRKILNLDTKEIFDAECIDIVNTTPSITSIGKFNFYTEAFEKANSILMYALSQNPNWLVIDEAGNLELNGKGFYTSIVKAIDFFSDTTSGNLLITVRDSLCKEVISFFNIKEFEIICRLEAIK
jgi:nucleoside-triphosphatase